MRSPARSTARCPQQRRPRLARFTRLLAAATLVAATACGTTTDPGSARAARVVLSDTSVSMRVGDDTAVTATARDAGGQPLGAQSIFWSSRDTTVATVSQAGVVRGIAPGTTQISANAAGQSAVATVTVVARPIAALTVAPVTAQLVVGGTQRLAARATNDAGGAVSASVTWTSLTPTVLGVAADGTVTALAPGVGSVRASVDSLAAVAVVVVTRVPTATVSVSPATAALTVGTSQQLTATPYDASGNALTGRDVSWTSTNAGVAAVSSTGQVTAIAPGVDTVTATVEGQTANAVVTVRQAPVASVTVSPASSSITTGGTVGLTAALADASGNPLAGRTVTWTSSATGTARVDANGTVTGVAAGTATITATSEGVSGTATVRVAAPQPAAVASVALSPTSAALTVGDTRTFTATPHDASGNAISGRTVTWSSSAASVASVSSAGVVTAAAPGSATITATVDGITGTAPVTVQQRPVAAVAVTPASSTVPAGSTAQLTATTRDASGNTLTGRVVSWASSNTSVATVTSTGVVTGSSAGSATITATSEGVTGSATVTVTAVVFVSPSSVTVTERGPTRTAQLVATDQSGHVLLAPDVTWASSNTAVAKVDAYGTVTAVSAQGSSAKATITATYRGATATATVTVNTK